MVNDPHIYCLAHHILESSSEWLLSISLLLQRLPDMELLARLCHSEIHFFAYSTYDRFVFSDLIAFVVYMTFRTIAENLKIGKMASKLSFQSFMEFGYFGVHFSVTLSNVAKVFFSSAA